MLLSALILLCACVAQEPSDQLQRALVSEEADERYAAAMELATGDAKAEKWLLRHAGKGTPEERRTLLLAAALMGTEDSLELVEKAAKKGRKPTPERAFALVLYGSMHPEAGLNAKKDWARAGTDFERGCLLAGLLAQPQRLADPDWQKMISKKKAPGLQEIFDNGAMLRGEKWSDAPRNPSSLGARLLSTHMPGVTGVSPELATVRSDSVMPSLWSVGARHSPPRKTEDLIGQALVDGRVALVLSMYEVEESKRQALFDHFRTRTVGSLESAWLWGAAGDLGLTLPKPNGDKLQDCVVAGILRLGLLDFDRAQAAADPYLPAARKAFGSNLSMKRRLPAAILLAFGAEDVDKTSLKSAFLAASGSDRQILQPIWKFANRSLGAVRQNWLKSWSRDLGAGWIGFLDKEGPRWIAYQLVGGTVAAEGREEIATPYPELQLVPKDYAGDHLLYRDLAVLLLDGVYRWGLKQ
ncbi:MAG: HEAT repeat domain-containing protein [Planctomycetes bacterium]|nr:HEAT repeat domain-containing protein [Planctomycetota bacterium]MCP4771657.1 HEAT repeat domain-containing protein [Planctomycetota bacterium]MCP4860043.1 HEAT repeat domain-containing protein [Planctomycetota bacterium]